MNGNRPTSSLLQAGVYGLVCASAVMLAVAEGALFPQFLTVPLAVFAFYAVERRRTVRLPEFAANILGLLAFALAVFELFAGTIEARLTAGAHLLVYLTWIVCLQAKASKHYWWMCALSVLQVAIGGVLSNTAGYGLMMAAYMVLAVWTLSVFSVHQARLQTAPRFDDEPGERPEPSRGTGAGGTAVGAKTGRGLLRPGTAERSLQLDPGAKLFGVRFIGGVLGMTLAAMLVAVVFFLLIPRHWVGRRTVIAEEESGPLLTGYSETVELGEMGEILESNEPVMEVRMFDHRDEEIEVAATALRLGYDEPLFRGNVLDTYENGRWSARNSGRPTKIRDRRRRERRRTIRQEFRIEPINSRILFAIHPQPIGDPAAAVGLDGRTRILQIPGSHVLLRAEPQSGPMAYEVHIVEDRPRQRIRRDYRQRKYLQLPADGLDRLRATARRIAGYDEQPRPGEEEVARRLEDWLKRSGGFTYSLQLERSNRSVDPIEEFLERKTGHCEYYASALALMLRAVGIPSRLVSGFKGGQVNRFSGAFEVEQRHAHAWVEAQIDGYWIVLDPTPAERAAAVADVAPSMAPWREFINFIKQAWSSHIVEINLTQQRNRIYDPLRETARSLWRSLTVRGSRKLSLSELLTEFVSSPERWFSWQGGLFTFVLLLLIVLLYWSVKRLLPVFRRIETQLRRHLIRRHRRVDFYERFLRLCRARGLDRRPTQTQREFALEVCAELQQSTDGGGLRQFPVELTDAFYEVRFGERELDGHRAERIDRELTRLESALANRQSTVHSR